MEVLNRIYNIINKIELEIASTNEKEKYLSHFKDDNDLKKFFKYCLDDVNYIYNKTSFKPSIKQSDYDPKQCPDYHIKFYEVLDDLNAGLRGKLAEERIQNFLSVAGKNADKLMMMVLKRKVGTTKVGKKIVNKIWSDLIPTAPYMRCEAEKMLEKRIIEEDYKNDNVIAQTKADGLFVNISIVTHVVNTTTRYGRSVPEDTFFRTFGLIESFIGNTLHGELLILEENSKTKFLPREVGNGLINSYFQRYEIEKNLKAEINAAKTEKKRDKLKDKLNKLRLEWKNTHDRLVYKIWDMVPTKDWNNLKCELTYKERFENVKEYVKEYNLRNNSLLSHIQRCQLIDFKLVDSFQEAMDFYQDQLNKGEEGAVIKKLDSIWVHDTNRTGIIKLKDFKECDLKIVGWNPGKEGTKYEKGIGSLICESSDGLIKVDLSGLSDKQRGFERVDLNDSSKGLKLIEGFDPDDYINKIGAVKYSYVIGDSLYLPSLLEIRELSDKNVADDSVKIRNL